MYRLSLIICLSTLLVNAHADGGGRAPANTLVPVPSPAARAAVRESSEQVPTEPAEGTPPEWLTGGWGGRRDALAKRGVTETAILKYDAGRNVSGGRRVGSFALWNLDLRLSLETEPMGLWSGGRAFVYYLLNDGQSPSSYIGDIQYTDNIDANGYYLGRLLEAWYQHTFLNERLSVLAGLHDMNTEFYVTDSSLPFLSSSLGLGSELGLSGVGGPSTFPVTAPALRVRFEPSKSAYASVGVYGAVSGDPALPQGTHARFNGYDGHMILAEAGRLRRTKDLPQSKFAVGGWAFTNPVRHLDGARGAHAAGAYVLYDQEFNARSSAFVRMGLADARGTVISANGVVGVLLKGVLPHRNDDLLGLAVTTVRAGRLLAYGEPERPLSYETAIEAFYRYHLTSGVNLQPDVQWVSHPFFDAHVVNSTSFILRAELSF